MSDRHAIIAGFLAETKWATWERISLVADASARRYERLEKDGATVILMDAPPENAESTAIFAERALYLKDCGLNPPDILNQDHELGLLVISDLGRNDYAKWLQTAPQDSTALYKTAIDVLVRLQTCSPPEGLTSMTPTMGAEMIEITGEHYAQTDVTDLRVALHTALERHAPNADTFAMRDFHAENLIWRPELTGTARVGLLDFQDAFIAPAGYDLASLLRDARRDLNSSFVDEMMIYFLEQTTRDDRFRAQLAVLGVQRNLRILGVFARLATVAHKKRYVDLIPRVWYNLQQDLAHPALQHLKQAVHDCVPAPDASLLERLRQ